MIDKNYHNFKCITKMEYFGRRFQKLVGTFTRVFKWEYCSCVTSSLPRALFLDESQFGFVL